MVALAAKGVTQRLEITGGTLAAPLEVFAIDALANIWSDEFIGERLETSPAVEVRYRVSFYVQPPREDVARVMYIVDYARDPADAEGGFVYLPGRNDVRYKLNVRTILRSEQDGRWHRASRKWSRALNRVLP